MMSDRAIDTEGVGKRYRIGARQRYRTLRDTLTEALSAPRRLFQNDRTRADDDENNSFIWSLRDVSFTVNHGDVVGIIGPNGAGKTTLLKILSRITEPTEGSVEIHGRIGSLLEVGTGFHPELTGRENIYLNGAILGMTRAEIDRKFDAVVAFAEVERFIDTPVKRYSSGMYVRLAFSVAAHLETDILLVDEVLSVGDAAFQRKCLGKMGEVRRQGRTIFFVSHNMASVTSLTNTCFLMNAGRMIASGPTHDIVQQYLTSTMTQLVSDGVADLTQRECRRGAIKPTAQQMQFQSVRLLDTDGCARGLFAEGEPITIELRFLSTMQAQLLELGCMIKTLEGVQVFSCLSGQQTYAVEPGCCYQTRVTLGPNRLRPGRYLIDLYLLSGVPQDLVQPAIQFQIEGRLDAMDDRRYAGDTGLIRVDYPWSDVTRVDAAVMV